MDAQEASLFLFSLLPSLFSLEDCSITFKTRYMNSLDKNANTF